MTAEDVVRQFRLEPLPEEGGFFRQTWLHPLRLAPSVFPGGLHAGSRAVGSAIYALFTPGDFSALHRLQSDEVWHFYRGDPVTMLTLYPDGSSRRIRLGAAFEVGETPQHLVPAGVWQGARPAPEGCCGWSLVGCTMAPAFDPADFELGERAALEIAYPIHCEEIKMLTRKHS